jgi:hypothetical protein
MDDTSPHGDETSPAGSGAPDADTMGHDRRGTDRQERSDGRADDHGDDGRTDPDEGADSGLPRLGRRGFLRATAAAGVLAGVGATSASAKTVVTEKCSNFAEFEVSNGNFTVINNQWGNDSANQCIQKYDDGTFGWTFSGGSDGINYPEVHSGTSPWGDDYGVSEFPLRRGDVEELVMEWDFDITVSGKWNLAEEWWLVNGDPGPDPDIRHEVMLVCDWGGGHGHGSDEETAIATDRFGNQIDYWQFYPSGGTSADFHIFKINGGASTGRVDLMEIYDYMSTEYAPNNDYTFTGPELGTELFDGPSGDVQGKTFNITINGSTYTLGGRASGTLQDGRYLIGNVHSGKMLDVEGWSTSDGGNVHQWSYTNAPNQQWDVESVGNGEYVLTNVNSGKVMDVEGYSTDNGANVQQWERKDIANQRFKITEAQPGQYRIEPAHSGKAVDVKGWSTADGGDVHQWDWKDNPNQRFRFHHL